jgi:hypothetical protein
MILSTWGEAFGLAPWGDTMTPACLRIAGLAAVVLISATSILRADTQGIPTADRRVLFDPAPMDQQPGRLGSGRERQSIGAANSQNLPPADFSYRGLDLFGTDLSAPAAPGYGSVAGRALSPAGPQPPPGFTLGIETDRATTAPPVLGDDPNAAEGAPLGRKPKKRFVPFIGLSAKTPIE